MEIDYPTKPFLGVRFVIVGVDSINERQIRSKLTDGGGVDVGLYTQSCTHVIVDKIVFDDPVCVAARTDGKTLVTSLWVDHSFDIGMPVDSASIMYRPLKDLNGVPGANSLVMCLTGYQQQDREDIMTMVGLMGAQFSKPLVANKVTHLICYKFEGEKYELAKKIKTIKLVNHRWLEDCLRDWELLPEASYDKSGYELETTEAEAKDSEDAVLKQFGGRDVNKSPHNLKFGIINACELPKSTTEGRKLLVASTVPGAPSGIDNDRDVLSTPGRVSRSPQISSFDNVNVPEANGCHTGASRNDWHERNPNSLKVERDLACTSKNAEISSHSGSKFSSMSYSRKTARKSTLTMSSRKVDDDVLDITSSKIENVGTRTATAHGETPEREGETSHEEQLSVVLPQKRMSNSPGVSYKSQKMSHNATACNPGNPVNHKTPVSETKSSLCHSLEIGNHMSPGNKGDYTDEVAKLGAALNKKPLTPDLPSFKTVTSEALHSESADRNALQTSQGSKESTVASKSSNEDFGIGSTHVVGEAGESQNLHHDFDGSSAKNRFLVMDNSLRPGIKDSPQEENDVLIAKPIRKKMVAKKTLGSRHTASGNGSIYSNKISSNNPVVCLSREEDRANQEKFFSTSELETAPPTVCNEAANEMHTKVVAKCGDDSFYKNETMDDETEAPDEKVENEIEKTINDEKSEGVGFIHKDDTILKRVPRTGHEENDSKVCGCDDMTGKEGMSTEVRMTVSGKKFDFNESTSKRDGVKQKISKLKKKPSGKVNGKPISADKAIIESMDDETEAPDEKDKNEFEKALNDEKSEGFNFIHNEDTVSKGIPGVRHEANDSIFCRHHVIPEKEGMNTEVGTTVSSEKFDLDESTSKRDGMKINKGKKRPSSKAKAKTVSTHKGTVESKKDVVGEETLDGEKNKEDTEKDKNVLLPRSKSRVSTASASKLGSSEEVGKENRPVADQGQTSGLDVRKSDIKSMKIPMKVKKNIVKVSSNSTPVAESLNKLRDEPVWFILSGHRLQRKEFQLVIKRLKGRLCRHSHQWSYQATHFIAPDPIRRTEKFFAAAASGRWILKTDYLSACSQAGKFLLEEPYEWHKNGLSEDGAINLEAPRKWRLLRERTGHGAFHGMRIIVYGDCIAPPLDTLKRVLKAGDGNILATSPPYTRFLTSGVDFAVVSPGMPSVDMWVQEFLNHEIPCVVADYLVEFVCKPGYSLDRHVLYNTHAWAEKSLANMLSKAEEIV